jgi:hypothetical protein
MDFEGLGRSEELPQFVEVWADPEEETSGRHNQVSYVGVLTTKHHSDHVEGSLFLYLELLLVCHFYVLFKRTCQALLHLLVLLRRVFFSEH